AAPDALDPDQCAATGAGASCSPRVPGMEGPWARHSNGWISRCSRQAWWSSAWMPRASTATSLTVLPARPSVRTDAWTRPQTPPEPGRPYGGGRRAASWDSHAADIIDAFLPLRTGSKSMTRPSSLDREQLLACGRGEMFGAGNARLPLPPMLMFDRITQIASEGGAFGKGLIRAEMDLHPDLWFFACHFEGDPVMP